MTAGYSESAFRAVGERMLVGGEQEEIAAVALFLISDAARESIFR